MSNPSLLSYIAPGINPLFWKMKDYRYSDNKNIVAKKTRQTYHVLVSDEMNYSMVEHDRKIDSKEDYRVAAGDRDNVVTWR